MIEIHHRGHVYQRKIVEVHEAEQKAFSYGQLENGGCEIGRRCLEDELSE